MTRSPLPERAVRLTASCILLILWALPAAAAPRAGTGPFRFMVRDLELPNQTAVDSGWVLSDQEYDTILEDRDGSFLRYGGVKADTPDLPAYSTNGTITGRAREDDRAQATSIMLVWFALPELAADHRVESAAICLNVMRWTQNDLSSGFMAARLDTQAADYAALNSVSPYADPSWLATTFASVDATHGVAWSPPLADRDDWHDFGPRGLPNRAGAVLGDRTADSGRFGIRLDVTDPVQQVYDAGTWSRGALFVLYTVDTPVALTSWMFGNGPLQVPQGNPQFTLTSSANPVDTGWTAAPVPVAMTWDDTYEDQVGYFTALADSGLAFDAAVTRLGFFSTGFDSLHAQNPGINIIDHSFSHGIFDTLATSRLPGELRRDWMVQDFSVPPDTTAIVDFAWPGGLDPTYSLTAIPEFIRFGYRSARATRVKWDGDGTANDFGQTTPLALDCFVNRYGLVAISGSAIFRDPAGGLADLALIEDQFLDHVDQFYTDYGRAALIFYAHRFAFEGIADETLRYFIGLVNRTGASAFMPYGDLIAERLARSPLVPPAAVTVSAGATAAQAASAARTDSLLQADGDPAYAQVWLAPLNYVGPVSGVPLAAAAATSRLGPAAPNPFNPRTVIAFELAGDGPVTLTVYDLRGRRIRQLVDGFRTRGPHRASWDGADAAGRPAAAGVYLIRLQAGQDLGTCKVLLVK